MEFSGMKVTAASVADSVSISVDKVSMQTVNLGIDNSRGIIMEKLRELQGESEKYVSVYEGYSSQCYSRAYEVLMYKMEKVDRQMKLLGELLSSYTDAQMRHNETAKMSVGGK